MQDRFFPCRYSRAPRCGQHVGYCKECRKYGRMTIKDRIVIATLVATLLGILLFILTSCRYDKKEMAAIEPITQVYHTNAVWVLRYDSCEYLQSADGGFIHKANCLNQIHQPKGNMDSSLYLFQNSQTINDIIGRIEQLASSKTVAYNLSIGISKNLHGQIKYSVMIVATDRHGKNLHRIIDGLKDPTETVRVLTEFLEAL